MSNALKPFCDWLEQRGLADFFACLDPLHPRYEAWAIASRSAPQSMRPLVELCILGQRVAWRDLAEAPQAALEGFLAEGVLKKHSVDEVSLGGLVLLPVQGLWLLCDRPRANPTLYFGDDSIALASRLRVQRGQRVLDLCCGPGVQALRLALMGGDVIGVELNPVAAALARINVLLNGLEDRVEVRVGSLYEPVQECRFDVVVANPPLLPMPEDVPYPFVGHGGPDGLSIVRRILNGMPQALSPTGIGRLLGTTLSDGYLPLCIDELQSWTKQQQMLVRMFVTSHHGLAPGDPYFEGLCDTAASTGRIEPSEARRRFRALLTEAGASHLCAYFFQVTRGAGAFELIDVAGDVSRDLWFA
jgi:release factor glutamine methyltransferase